MIEMKFTFEEYSALWRLVEEKTNTAETQDERQEMKVLKERLDKMYEKNLTRLVRQKFRN